MYAFSILLCIHPAIMKISLVLCGALISTLGFVESGFLHGNNHGLIGTPISTSSLITTRTFHAGPSIGGLGRGNSLGSTYGGGYSAGYGSGHGSQAGTGGSYATGSSGAALGTPYGYISGGGSPTVSAVSTYGYNAVASNTGGGGGGNSAYGYNSGYGHGRY